MLPAAQPEEFLALHENNFIFRFGAQPARLAAGKRCPFAHARPTGFCSNHWLVSGIRPSRQHTDGDPSTLLVEWLAGFWRTTGDVGISHWQVATNPAQPRIPANVRFRANWQFGCWTTGTATLSEFQLIHHVSGGGGLTPTLPNCDPTGLSNAPDENGAQAFDGTGEETTLLSPECQPTDNP